MNVDNLKAINIHSYDLPEDVIDGWNEMIDFIEDYNELRMIKLKMHYDVFIMDMEARGFTRKQIEDEIKAYYKEKNIKRKENDNNERYL